MPIFVETNTFRKAAAFAVTTLPKRSSVPELLGMWVESDDGRLTLTAYDGTRLASAELDAQTDGQPLNLLVNGAALASAAKALPASQPKARLTATEGGLTLRCGKALFGLRAMLADGYPDVPEPPEEGAVTAHGPDFRRMLEAVGAAVSKPGAVQAMPALMSSD